MRRHTRPTYALQVAQSADKACEHGANISQSTRVHARVTPECQIPPVCGAFVADVTRPCPRFPRLSQDGKEGVEGWSPSEGLEVPANQDFCCLLGAIDPSLTYGRASHRIAHVP
jgi:hypothetical protein